MLEIGTGSGYSTAVLALLAGEVLSIERFDDLAVEARARLDALDSGPVEVRVGDGTRGAPDRAPFDAIAVHASAPAPPPSLLAQLRPGGRMVIPLAEPRRRRAHPAAAGRGRPRVDRDRALPLRPPRRGRGFSDRRSLKGEAEVRRR